MEFEVEREGGAWPNGQYHVREKGQVSRGTTLTDGWLKSMGIGPLSRLNIDAAINATMASTGGVVLDTHAQHGIRHELGFVGRTASYRQAPVR